MTKPKYTPEKIIANIRYRELLMLVLFHQLKHSPIRRSQLIEALVHGNYTVTTPIKFTKLYEEGQFTKEQYLRGKKIYEQTTPQMSQFKSELALRNAIIRLKDLKMVRSVKPKGKYHYLIVTDFGIVAIKKYQIIFWLKYINDPEFLLKLDKALMIQMVKEKEG